MLHLLLTAAIALTLAAQPAVQASPQAAPAPAPAPEPAAATTDADPALWVVKDRDTTIYLFGTVHVLKPGLGWFDEAVRTAFDRSDEVVLEMVMPGDQAMQQLVMSKAMNPTGPSLSERLPADERAEYVAALTALGIPAAGLDRFDPWFASTTLSMVSIMKGGYQPNSGAEVVITAAAKESGKPVLGLETPEQQIGFLDDLPEAAQVTLLTATVEQLPRMSEVLGDMVSAWSAGDPDRLGEVMNESLRESPEVAKILLNDRNERWADWIRTRLDKPGTVFIAVGAGHLAGKDSVQAKLDARKLKVERVAY